MNILTLIRRSLHAKTHGLILKITNTKIEMNQQQYNDIIIKKIITEG